MMFQVSSLLGIASILEMCSGLSPAASIALAVVVAAAFVAAEGRTRALNIAYIVSRVKILITLAQKVLDYKSDSPPPPFNNTLMPD